MAALVLAFIVVQGANLQETVPAGSVLNQELTEIRASSPAIPPSSDAGEMLPLLLVPLLLATFCYLTIRRSI